MGNHHEAAFLSISSLVETRTHTNILKENREKIIKLRIEYAPKTIRIDTGV